MPSYQNLLPPISLAPGDVGFSFNNEAFPGSAQAGSQFAISSFAGQPDTGTAVRWQTIFGTANEQRSLHDTIKNCDGVFVDSAGARFASLACSGGAGAWAGHAQRR